MFVIVCSELAHENSKYQRRPKCGRVLAEVGRLSCYVTCECHKQSRKLLHTRKKKRIQITKFVLFLSFFSSPNQAILTQWK